MPAISDPSAIEKRSFEIIEELLKTKKLRSPDKDVVMRVVHATADPDFADNMAFSNGAVEAGVSAIKSGCVIVTDVKMLKAGVSTDRPAGGDVICLISDPETVSEAKQAGTTRAAAAMRRLGRDGRLGGAIVAIGNAPTALYEVLDLIRQKGVRPALVVGVPVGFVGAAESKEELLDVTEVPFITCRGRKGGSPVGAAIINALIKLSKS